MARIPEEELERLKKEIALERLVEAHGVQLKRHGADLIGLCPFHDDKDPSLVVSPAKNLWHCLGACQTGGSVIDWVMRSEGVSFRHAVELLRSDAPLGADRPAAPAVRRLPAPVDTSADDAELLGQVIDFYHQTLKANPEALAYLEQHGLTHPDLIEHLKLGYANRTLGLRLPQKAWKYGEAGRLESLAGSSLRLKPHNRSASATGGGVKDAKRRAAGGEADPLRRLWATRSWSVWGQAFATAGIWVWQCRRPRPLYESPAGAVCEPRALCGSQLAGATPTKRRPSESRDHLRSVPAATLPSAKQEQCASRERSAEVSIGCAASLTTFRRVPAPSASWPSDSLFKDPLVDSSAKARTLPNSPRKI